MIVITVEVDCPSWMIQGVKEDLAMYLELNGDVRIVQVLEDVYEQLMLEEGP